MRPDDISDDQVECRVCGKRFKALNRHLGKHNLTADTYREMFPGALITSPTTRKLRSEVFHQAILDFLETPEGEEWRQGQSERGLKFAEENPGFRRKTDEHKRKIGDGVHKFHVAHPDAASEKMTPKVVEQIKKTLDEYWETLGLREKQSEIMIQYCADHPGFRKWKPGQAENHKASQDRFLVSPAGLAWRKQQSEMMTELGKKRWEEDPESLLSFIEAGQNCVVMKDTKPELQMREILNSLHLTYEPQGRIAELAKPHRFHKWDFTLPEYKIAVECDGCYWHGCPEHYPERLQEEAMQSQVALEEKRDTEADLSGWSVLRFWGHEIESQTYEIAELILRTVNHQIRMTG